MRIAVAADERTGIAETVVETANERRKPRNFEEVYESLSALATSDNRARKNAFAVELGVLKDLVKAKGDPAKYLGAIGEEFDGWTTGQIASLVRRLEEKSA